MNVIHSAKHYLILQELSQVILHAHTQPFLHHGLPHWKPKLYHTCHIRWTTPRQPTINNNPGQIIRSAKIFKNS